MKKTGLIFIFCMAAALRLSGAEWRLTGSQRLNPGPASAAIWHKTVSCEREVELRMAAFDAKHCTLEVVDNPDGTATLGEAMERRGCLAGVNGNYFRSDRSPIGLVICNGKEIHPLEHAKLLSGVLTVTRRRIALLRTAEYRTNPEITQALQAGPFLVDRGQPVPGLNATRSAERTVVLGDGAGHCALLISGPVTLVEMARILEIPGLLPGWKVVRALNLDGGSSSAFWVREPPFYRREFKIVRNFLGVAVRR